MRSPPPNSRSIFTYLIVFISMKWTSIEMSKKLVVCTLYSNLFKFKFQPFSFYPKILA